ncbi:MAG: hypothetical protein FWG46_08910 [Treponema sp.]|nr:hypothetical protein [Treponema sp.]
MKRTIITIGLFSLAVLLLSSCIYVDGGGTHYQNFNYNLRGTWETQPGSYYNCTVVIDYNTIRISGSYIPSPLSRFTPYSSLKGYTEETSDLYLLKEGFIYIQDKGTWQNPLQYTYWVTEYPQSEKRLTLLPSNLTLFYKYP